MKLSMWMIANRLSSLDMELDLSDEAPVILNSARRAYATNCVYVHEDGKDAVCEGEGGIIRILNTSATQAFEIIQSVFDYFEDWADRISSYILEKNYQDMVDSCWQVFHNPLVLFDANNKVLGMTSRYPADAVDEEWKHLCEFGYSSILAARMLKQKYSYIDFEKRGSQFYRIHETKPVSFSGISYCMYFDEFACGRLNLLDKERPLNPGDVQILEFLARQLEPVFAQYYHSGEGNTGNVFLNLMVGKPCDEEILKRQMDYQQWAENDDFCVTLIRLAEGGVEKDKELNMLFRMTERSVPDCIVVRNPPYVAILSNRDLSKDPVFFSRMRLLSEGNPIQIGFSLPCRGLPNARVLYAQAEAAFSYAEMEGTAGIFFPFFDYAKDYLLDSGTLEEKKYACMPAVRSLWEGSRKRESDLFLTLKIFLDCDCSVTRTAAALESHRNTISYRIRKIREILHDDLGSSYVREYVRLSVQTLELYGKKEDQKKRKSAGL